jgi:hypothetical protein
MDILFLLVCCMSLVFFGIFFVACHRDASRKKPRTSSVVKVSPEIDAVGSNAGRQSLVDLEKQMADFLGSHQRADSPNSSAFVQQVASRTDVWRTE